MTRIDLIPPEVVEKHRARRFITIMGIAFAFIFIFLLIVYLLTLGQAVVMNNNVQTIKNENKKVLVFNNGLKSYEDRAKTLDSQQAILSKVTQNEVAWSGILNDISMVTPSDVWLTDIKIDLTPILTAQTATSAAAKTDLKPPITISGYALNHAAVARWLVHLDQISSFRSAWLDSAVEQDLPVSEQTGTTQAGVAAPTAQPVKGIRFQTTVYLTKFKEAGKGSTTP